MVAILIVELLHAHADRALATGDQKSRKPARAWPRASDQMNMRYGFPMGRLWDAAQPYLFRVRRKAFTAVVTIAPMVSPLLFAYFRRTSTVRGGSFKVTGIVVSGISTGRSSWEA